MLHRGLILAFAGALGCTQRTMATEPPAPIAAPAPRPSARPTAPQEDASLAELRLRGEADGTAKRQAQGTSKDNPLPTCGPNASYIAIADVECEDGSRPLGGDIPQGMRSRRGSLGANDSGHIIDLYEVTCPAGPKQIFVDMYGCDQAKPSRSEQEVDRYMEEMLVENKFTGFVERCLAEEAHGPGRVSLMLQTCLPVMPTALRQLGKMNEANAWLAKYCAGTPPASDTEPKRYKYLTQVLVVHEAVRVRQGKTEAEAARERKAITGDYAKTCAVDAKAFEAWTAANLGP